MLKLVSGDNQTNYPNFTAKSLANFNSTEIQNEAIDLLHNLVLQLPIVDPSN